MTVSVEQYDNEQNIILSNFIANLKKSYPADGVSEDFEVYKKNLSESQLPKAGSLVFEGIIGENPVKEVYFTNKDKVYEFGLIGNCGTGSKYSKDAEKVFDKMLTSIKF